MNSILVRSDILVLVPIFLSLNDHVAIFIGVFHNIRYAKQGTSARRSLRCALHLSPRLRLPDSSLDVGFIDHVDGLEMFDFRKSFRGLDRGGKLVKLHLVPLAIPHNESSASRMLPVHRGRSVQHQDIASLGGNITRRLDAFYLDHMLPCLRWSIFPETTYW